MDRLSKCGGQWDDGRERDQIKAGPLVRKRRRSWSKHCASTLERSVHCGPPNPKKRISTSTALTYLSGTGSEPRRLKINIPYHQVQLISKRSFLIVVFASNHFGYFGWNEPVTEEEREAGDWVKWFLVVAAAPSLIFVDAVVCFRGADGWIEAGGIKDVGVYLIANLSWEMEEVTCRRILCLHHFWEGLRLIGVSS